jgi:hypothetical protein
MQYDAKAIGSGSEGAQTELQEEYHKVIICNIFLFAYFFYIILNNIINIHCVLVSQLARSRNFIIKSLKTGNGRKVEQHKCSISCCHTRARI